MMRGFCVEKIAKVLDELEAKRLLSESRFVESFIRAGLSKGQGPIKIQYDLRQKGIGEDALPKIPEWVSVDWVLCAQRVLKKRFGESLPQSFTDKQKQMRFLQQRGFTQSQIQQAFSDEERNRKD